MSGLSSGLRRAAAAIALGLCAATAAAEPATPSPPDDATAASEPAAAAAPEPTAPTTAAAEPPAPSPPPAPPEPPPAPPAQSPPPDARAEAEAEVDEAGHGLEDDATSIEGLDDLLSPDVLALYGFTDFTFERIWAGESISALAPHSTFYIGNLNVYLDAQLAPQWRALSEVRFTYLPHGSFDQRSGAVVDATYLDYADNFSDIRVGGVEIERVWLEYEPTPYFRVRVGQFLTPYGIWNVDHGSPALIGVQKPYLTSAELFPERQTGLMLHGIVRLSTILDLVYHATLTNGRGSVDAYRDLDGNKAVGGRLELRHVGEARYHFGVSAYAGRYTESELSAQVTGAQIDLTTEPVVRYDEQSLAADARLEWKGLQLLAEIALDDQVFEPGLRRRALWQLSEPLADGRRWGTYALVAYTIDPLGLTPFLGYDHIRDPFGFRKGNVLRAGLRFVPIARVTLKGEYVFARADTVLADSETIQGLRFQVAWAF